VPAGAAIVLVLVTRGRLKRSGIARARDEWLRLYFRHIAPVRQLFSREKLLSEKLLQSPVRSAERQLSSPLWSIP
jgi:hypothetical protein